MSRPLRINYENAFYHVMNRGTGRRDIFLDEEQHQLFLSTVAEASDQFGIEIHAYCLMSNHYHLLIKTPLANLSRAMRHINGLYTQRFNRLTKTDGALFRGRYKAILVDSDAYLLHLSKYIHLNPLEARMVDNLEQYQWSSYRAYIEADRSPRWLIREEIYGQLSHPLKKSQQYKVFMDNELLNHELIKFYNKQRLSPILGDEVFINRLKLSSTSLEVARHERLIHKPALINIIDEVAKMFDQPLSALTSIKKGRGQKNVPRMVAMYIAQKYGDYKLTEIANAFGLKHYGSASYAIINVSKTVQIDTALACIINHIITRLDP